MPRRLVCLALDNSRSKLACGGSSQEARDGFTHRAAKGMWCELGGLRDVDIEELDEPTYKTLQQGQRDRPSQHPGASTDALMRHADGAVG
jgi:hypothetical protein